MNRQDFKKVFSDRLRNVMEMRFPGVTSDNGLGFELLKHFNKNEADLCSSGIDRAQAARRYVNWIQGRAVPDCCDLSELCTFLKCDAAYLLGHQTEINRSTFEASKTLGISEKAVEKMRSYPDSLKILVCDMTCSSENDLLLKTLSEISYYVCFSGGYFSWAKFPDSKPKQIKEYMSEHLLKSATLDGLSKILDQSKAQCKQTELFADTRHFIESHKRYDDL